MKRVKGATQTHRKSQRWKRVVERVERELRRGAEVREKTEYEEISWTASVT